MSPELTSPEDVLERVFRLFGERGASAYLGEAVSQKEHAVQAAWAAEQARASPSQVAAALLHDVGHLLSALPDDRTEQGMDRHEELGARWLERHFGPAVSEPVRLHVPAKRYLCATEPAYFRQLSAASVESLKLQGGPMTAEEIAEFETLPYAREAVALRRWDDAAKVPGLLMPELSHFRSCLEVSLVRSGA